MSKLKPEATVEGFIAGIVASFGFYLAVSEILIYNFYSSLVRKFAVILAIQHELIPFFVLIAVDPILCQQELVHAGAIAHLVCTIRRYSDENG